EISGPLKAVVAEGGDRPRAALAVADQAFLAHEPLDGAAGDPDAVLVELVPDLVGAVHRQVLFEDPSDLRHQLGVAQRSLRGLALLGNVVGVRGDPAAVLTQHPADRLDPEAVAMVVDERDQRLDWRSSSAPKKADAALRISFARRSSLFSRSSCLIRSRSSVVTPSRRPWSTSARRTHTRRVSRLMSSFSAIEQ